MNIRDRVTYLIQKYDQQERDEQRSTVNSVRHQADCFEKYGTQTKQRYLDDFDTAIA